MTHSRVDDGGSLAHVRSAFKNEDDVYASINEFKDGSVPWSKSSSQTFAASTILTCGCRPRPLIAPDAGSTRDWASHRLNLEGRLSSCTILVKNLRFTPTNCSRWHAIGEPLFVWVDWMATRWLWQDQIALRLGLFFIAEQDSILISAPDSQDMIPR